MHREADIDLIEPCLVEFEANKVDPSRVVWIDYKKYLANCGHPTSDKNSVTETFKNAFSYAIPGGKSFESVPFSRTETKTFKAERYGGAGVGDNGGGVRCGTVGSYQVKGIGQNPLVGSAEKTWHSYGGLNALDAIYEAIYGYALNAALPIGVANIYGLIITGHNSAYIAFNDYDPDDQKESWGALLIREYSLRPGHFVRAGAYKPKEGSGISDDVTRVRLANHALHKSFDTPNCYIRYLGAFLSNCANQLAFARMARITHGSLTPSNLCFDGRWIDLTNSSFINSGVNIGGCPPFQEEPQAIVPILIEAVYTYSKYNNIELNVSPLVNYYAEQFESYLVYYASYVLGLNYERIPRPTIQKEYAALAKVINFIITRNNRIVNEWPASLDNNDPLLLFLTALYTSGTNHSKSMKTIHNLTGKTESECLNVIDCYATIIEMLEHKIDIHRAFHKTHHMLTSLKRCRMTEYFFKGRLDGHIREAVTQSHDGELGYLVDESTIVADWMFDIDSSKVVLFQNRTESLVYSAANGRFNFTKNGTLEEFDSAKETALFISKLPSEIFLWGGYDFKYALLDILHIVENSNR